VRAEATATAAATEAAAASEEATARAAAAAEATASEEPAGAAAQPASTPAAGATTLYFDRLQATPASHPQPISTPDKPARKAKAVRQPRPNPVERPPPSAKVVGGNTRSHRPLSKTTTPGQDNGKVSPSPDIVKMFQNQVARGRSFADAAAGKRTCEERAPVEGTDRRATKRREPNRGEEPMTDPDLELDAESEAGSSSPSSSSTDTSDTSELGSSASPN
jgi:hypothetical protein